MESYGRCNCGGYFVKRTNSDNGNQFLGCSNYPNCHITKRLDEDIIIGSGDYYDQMYNSLGGFSFEERNYISTNYEREMSEKK